MKQYRRLVCMPEDGEYTVQGLKTIKLGGRHPISGRVVVGELGGGRKQLWRMIDRFRKPNTDGTPFVEKVFCRRYDPCRTSDLALVAGGDKIRWILATENMKIGDIIKSHGDIPINPVNPGEGDSHPLGALPVNTELHNIEMYPGKGGFFVMAGGSHAKLVRKIGNKCVVKLPSKREISVSKWCTAVVGRVSNPPKNSIPIGTPNRMRRLGFRGHTGLWTRKDGYCGRKIRPMPPTKVYSKPHTDDSEKLVLNLDSVPLKLRDKPAILKKQKDGTIATWIQGTQMIQP